MPKLEKSDLLEWFSAGAKPSIEWKIGTEHEKFVFNIKNSKRVNYSGPSGISELLDTVASKHNWDKIIENNNTIALQDNLYKFIKLFEKWD